MSDDRSLGWLVALAVAVGGAVVSACAVPPIDDQLPTTPSTTAKGDNNDQGTPEVALGDPTAAPDLEGQTPNAPKCSDECATEGQKRCSTASASGTEVCKMSEGGCRVWTPGADCEADFSCDKTKNDGTCQAGCSNDDGCSATNAGVAHCTADGTTELTCTQVGACYVFKTTRSDVAQDCVSPTYCGAASGRRVSCVASAAGACTQHVAAYNDCPAGTACTGAGVCTATTSPPPTTGCYSSTQGKTMGEGACVLSAGDGVVEQCHGGLWYRGVVGNSGPYGACK
ncbi:MAG: hypothetical protein JWO86_6440 [Myxococcaceae bacterium]|nr:hypothetical protein [Myxococcaceae bacterium]